MYLGCLLGDIGARVYDTELGRMNGIMGGIMGVKLLHTQLNVLDRLEL